MNFNNHNKLAGLHAPFSPSQSSWLRYDDEKVIEVYRNKQAAQIARSLSLVIKICFRFEFI